MTVPAINSISGAQNQQTFSDINALISAPQKYQSTPADTFVKEGGGKKKTVIGVVIGAVAAAATAALIIFNVVAKKRAPQIDTHLLKDINFSKGTATLQDGSKFSGVIEDTHKTGKKITMEYQDGKILKSVGEDLYKLLREKDIPVRIFGDAKCPAKFVNATSEAFYTAMNIGV